MVRIQKSYRDGTIFVEKASPLGAALAAVPKFKYVSRIELFTFF